MTSRIKAAHLIGCIVAALSPATPGSFAGQDTYRTIVTRNPFGLGLIADPKPFPPTIPVTPPAQIELTGLSTLNVPGRAFFKLTHPDRKKPEYRQLAAGQTRDGLKVIALDIRKMEVVIEVHGIPQLLKLRKTQPKRSAPSLPGIRPRP